ncbi:trafficking protein particle complex subunit 1-like [Rhopilema esculentum]|uniref:trafficking protein particle complex subunit 1-like n=1 Tax=Rhopilema esculentum TaxID=499914 RepID=UPI0031E43B43
MTIYNMYMFDRNGTCLFYQEWQRRKDSQLSKDEEFKLTYGMLFSLKSFVSRISPVDPKDNFVSYKTNRYKFHLYETPTGVKILMNTDINVTNINEYLHYIYMLYVDVVIKSPVSEIGEPIESELFSSSLNNYIQSLPIYQ